MLKPHARGPPVGIQIIFVLVSSQYKSRFKTLYIYYYTLDIFTIFFAGFALLSDGYQAGVISFG